MRLFFGVLASGVMERRGTIVNNADRRCRLSQLTQPYKGRGRINGASVMPHVRGLQLGGL